MWIVAKGVRGTEQSENFEDKVNTLQTNPKMKQKNPSLWNKSKEINAILPRWNKLQGIFPNLTKVWVMWMSANQ